MAALISINDFQAAPRNSAVRSIAGRHAREDFFTRTKARPIEAKIKINVDEKPLCVRYAELLWLRKKVLESAKPMRDNRLDLR